MVDVRDSEYIWCKAIVIAITEQKDKEPQLLVHYKGWNKKYDESLPISSPRIAKFGFYTSRTDIPRYEISEN